MIGYRMIMSTELKSFEQNTAIDVLEEWFQNKGFYEIPKSGQVISNPHGPSLKAQTRSIAGEVEAWRWTLSEEWEPLEWYKNVNTSNSAETRITLAVAGAKVWLWTDIEPPTLDYIDRNGKRVIEPRYTGTPKFVKSLLSKISLTDGKAQPAGTHQTIDSPAMLDHLIEVIEDSERISAVFVTSPPEATSPANWFSTSSELLKNTEGMGVGYFLTTELLQSFNAWSGPFHEVEPGSIRTFLPGARFGDQRDGLQHRILRAQTIYERDPAKLRRKIRNSQVNRLATVRLPDALRKIDIEFSDQRLDRNLRQEVHSSESTLDVQNILREIGELSELLQIADREGADLRRELDVLKPDLLELRDENDLLYLEASDRMDEFEQAKREAAHLRRKLEEADAYEFAYAKYEVTESPIPVPSTFSDLIESLSELGHVKFFGDRDITEDLDDFPDLGATIVQKTWEALLTFEAYAEARANHDYSGGLIQYQRNAEHGRYMRIRQMSARESDTVMQNKRMREQRIFDVPEEVSPNKRMLMVSHIPLATGRGRSPRLYFEDTCSQTGYVSVGYIGPHLDNKSTN